MARLLRVAGAIALAAWGADPAPPDCRTPLGAPCFTIRFQHTQWLFFRNGSADFLHSTWTSAKAARRDGSSVEITGGGEFRKWFKRETRAAGSATMYLAPEDRVISIDHEQKTIARRAPLMWDDRPYRYSIPGDRTCLSGIRHWGTHFFLRGTDTVAGVPVIKWMGSNSGGGYTEIYLAPSLDCRPLKTHTVYRKFGVVPISTSTAEAVSVELGEPKAELFFIPSAYREVER